MRIGQAARLTGLSHKAIRHYDGLGLLPGLRRDASYRDFSAADVDRLRLIAHGRSLGFSLEDIAAMLGEVDKAAPACPAPAPMAALIRARLDDIDREQAALARQQRRLEQALHHVTARAAASA